MTDQKRGRGRPKKDKAAAPNTGDYALLGDEALKRIEVEAQEEATREHLAEAEERVREELKARHKQQLKTKTDPTEEMVDVLIDLAPHADRITLDGVIYLHGHTYNVSKRVKDTIVEICDRTWEHERETGSANSKHYKPPREIKLSPTHLGVPNAQLMKV